MEGAAGRRFRIFFLRSRSNFVGGRVLGRETPGRNWSEGKILRDLRDLGELPHGKQWDLRSILRVPVVSYGNVFLGAKQELHIVRRIFFQIFF